MGSIYYASLCFGLSQHSLWKDKEMSAAPMRQLTRHWFRVSIYFTDIASLNIYIMTQSFQIKCTGLKAHI